MDNIASCFLLQAQLPVEVRHALWLVQTFRFALTAAYAFLCSSDISYAGRMGTVLSLSPSYRKAVLFEDGPATVGHYTAVQNSKNAKDAAAAAAKSLKRPSIINVLPWKRIVAVSAKRKGSKKLQSDGGDGGKGSSPDGNATAMTNSASNSLKLKKSQSCANLSSYASSQDPSVTSTTTSSQLPTSKTLANVVTVTAKKNSLTGSGIQPSTAAGTPKRVIVQVSRTRKSVKQYAAILTQSDQCNKGNEKILIYIQIYSPISRSALIDT